MNICIYLPGTDERPGSGSNKHTGSEPAVPCHMYSRLRRSRSCSAGRTLLIVAATAAARRPQSLPNPSGRPLRKNPSWKKVKKLNNARFAMMNWWRRHIGVYVRHMAVDLNNLAYLGA